MRVLMCSYGFSHQTDGSGSLQGVNQDQTHLIFDSRLLSALRWGFQRDYTPQREGMCCLLFTWQSLIHTLSLSPSRCTHRPLYMLIYTRTVLTNILVMYLMPLHTFHMHCCAMCCLSSYWSVYVCVTGSVFQQKTAFPSVCELNS